MDSAKARIAMRINRAFMVTEMGGDKKGIGSRSGTKMCSPSVDLSILSGNDRKRVREMKLKVRRKFNIQLSFSPILSVSVNFICLQGGF